MKILHIITTLEFGGAERMLIDLVREQRRLGYDVHVHVMRRCGTPLEYEMDVAAPTTYGPDTGMYSPYRLFALLAVLRQDYDIVHTHLFPAQLWAGVACTLRSSSALFVTTEHSTNNRRRGHWLFKIVERFVYGPYARIFCVSDATANELRNWLPEFIDRIVVVQNGVDLRRFHAGAGAPVEDSRPVVVCVSRLEMEKDHETLLRAFALLPEGTLWLVGNGSRREDLQRLAKQLGIQQRVKFFGHRQDVPELLTSADIFVQSSHYEGFGLAAVEAMASQLPVIATDVPGLREVVGDIGVLIPPGDIHALALTLKQLARDPEKREVHGRAGVERARLFSVEQTARKYLEAYKISKPRVVLVITLSILGGAQIHVRELIRYFKDVYEFHLVSSAEGPLLDEVRAMGVSTYVLPNLVREIHPIKDALATWSLYRLLRRLRPQLVHLHSSKAGVVGRAAAALARVPAIFTAHGWAFTEGAPHLNRMIGFILERTFEPLTQRIISVSNYDAQLALRHKVVRPQKLIVIHNGIPDQDAAGARPSDAEGDVLGVMIARFSPPKAQHLVLRALARTPSVRVRFVGGGERLQDCRDLALNLGVADRVEFVGEVNEVWVQLQDAHFALLVSEYEGFPLAILEAMRAGLAVIATDVGGMPESVHHERNGLLVPPGSESGLSAAMRRLAQDSELRLRLGRQARQDFLTKFHLSESMRKTRDVYEGTLRTRRKP